MVNLRPKKAHSIKGVKRYSISTVTIYSINP